MSKKNASVKRYQDNIAVSHHQMIGSSPSNQHHFLNPEEIEKLVFSPAHMSRQEDENIQNEFAKVIKKQAIKKAYDMVHSQSEDQLVYANQTAKKRIVTLIKNSKKRMGFQTKDKEYNFNKNLDGFKHLKTYFEISELMKLNALTPSNSNQDKKDEVKLLKQNAKVELPQIVKGRTETHRAEPPSDVIIEEFFLEKGRSPKRETSQSKHLDSTSHLARSLADHALRKAKDRNKFISMMDTCSTSKQASKMSQIHDHKRSCSITIDQDNDFDSDHEQVDDEDMFEEQKIMQRAREEVERDWEAHQKLRLVFKRQHLLQSLISSLESGQINQNGPDFQDGNFQKIFFKLLEEQLKAQGVVEPSKFNKEDELELQKVLENLDFHFKGKAKRKLDSDVKLAEDLMSHKLRSTKVIKLLKGLTKRIMKNNSLPRMEENIKFFDQQREARDTRLAQQESSEFSSFLHQSKGRVSVLDVSSKPAMPSQKRGSSEKKRPNLKSLGETLQIQIPKRNGSKNLNISIVSSMRTPIFKLNEIESKERSIVEASISKPSTLQLYARKENGTEILNEENHLMVLESIPSIQKCQENQSLEEGKEFTRNARKKDATIKFAESPLKSPSMADLTKIKSKVVSKSHTSSPKLKTITNLDAKNSGKKIMKFNDRLLEIEKQSENIQKAMHQQIKKIDRQSDRLGNFYTKKYREYQLKIDKVPENLLKNVVHDRYNRNKRQEFQNNLSKKLLNSVFD